MIDDEKGEIVYRNFVDVSVAVQAPKGLVVPVMRDVQKMTFFDCENVAPPSRSRSSCLQRRPRTTRWNSRRCPAAPSPYRTAESSDP